LRRCTELLPCSTSRVGGTWIDDVAHSRSSCVTGSFEFQDDNGAFHVSKPSDLIPELQGRFPIRVELESLTRDAARSQFRRADG